METKTHWASLGSFTRHRRGFFWQGLCAVLRAMIFTYFIGGLLAFRHLS